MTPACRPHARGLVLAVLLATARGAQAPIVPTPIPPEVVGENSPENQLVFDIEIENRPGGEIRARLPGGVARMLGRVRRPARWARPVVGGFHASYYVHPGIVCATAVNAIHIKAGGPTPYDPRRPTENPALTITLAPAESSPPAADSISGAELLDVLGPACASVTSAMRDPMRSDDGPGPAPWTATAAPAADTVYTDIRGGTGLFGGPYAPYTGNPVDVAEREGAWTPLETFAGPDPTRPLPELMRIRVMEPREMPEAIEIENWSEKDRDPRAGQVRLLYRGRPPRVVGEVLKRVRGTGEFAGGQFVGVGALRANHAGVVCLSTSPKGRLGGFQVVPANHARYMQYPEGQGAYQWLIVGSVGSARARELPGYTRGYLDRAGRLNFRPSPEGVAPLYAYFLRPGDVGLKVRRRPDVSFSPCPEIIGRTQPGIGAGSTVDAWEAIRLELPPTSLAMVAASISRDGLAHSTQVGDGPEIERLVGPARESARAIQRLALMEAISWQSR